MKKRSVLLAVVMVVVLSMVLACQAPVPAPAPSPAPAPAKEVTILNLSDLTGRAASINIPATAVIQGWAEYVNAQGGIKGKKGAVTIKVMVADTQYDVAKAKEAWARAKDAKAIVAWHMRSGLAEGMITDVERDKIPMVAGSWGLKAPWSEWIYGSGHPGLPDCTGTEGVQAMKKLVGPTASKLGFISTDAPFAPMFLTGVDDYLKQQGVTISKEIFPAGSPDVTANLLRLKAAGVDAIYAICTVADMVTFNKDLNRLGWQVPVIHSNCTGAADLAALGGWDFIDGRHFANFYVPIEAVPSYQGPGHKLAREIFAKYRPGEKVTDNAVYGLIGALVMGGAIRKALDSVTPEELTGETLKKYGLDMLDNLDMMGLTSNITYKAGNHHPGPNRARIWKVDKTQTEGKLVAVSDWFQYTSIKPKV